VHTRVKKQGKQTPRPESDQKGSDRCKENKAKPTDRHHSITLNQGGRVHPRATPATPLGEQYHARTAHGTLIQHNSHAQLLAGTGEKRTPGDSGIAHRSDVAQGTKASHDGPATMPVYLDVRRFKKPDWKHMSRVCSICWCRAEEQRQHAPGR
jgi:hypothetical protein